jgi:RNA polymerase sigma-70 factor (ECF subfamily)
VELLPEVFTKYGKMLARSVARIVGPQDIEDVVQETYMRVFQASRTQPIRSPKAFMLKTARNIALDRIARADALNHVEETKESSDPEGEFPSIPVEQTPESVLQSEQEFLVCCRAIRELPRQCRRAFLLRKVYGLSQREVASRLGVSEGTVEKHLAKAMVETVRYMQAHGYVRPSSSQMKPSRWTSATWVR